MYQPLQKYLQNRFADNVVLTFAEIEDLIGFALPDQARKHLEWWTEPATDFGQPNHADSWISASRTARPNLSARTVAFERAS